MPAVTISLINQKGGCGKSSSCFHLAGAFARGGAQVLLVDADPQGSLGQAFFGSAEVETLSVEETLAILFEDEIVLSDPATLAVPTPISGVSLVRANQLLAPHNAPSPETSGLKQQTLVAFLEDLVADFDIILIDCPPNLYQCSWNALLASDFVVVPVPPEDFGTQGLRVVHQAIEHARVLNPTLELLGHLVTRLDRRLLLHQAYERKLRELYGEHVFATTVPEASAFKVALAARKPVSQFSPRSAAAEAIEQLAQELVQRMHAARKQTKVA